MRKRKDNLYQRIGIYAIHCLINDKMYIGQTEMNFGDRRDNHYALLNNNKHHIEDLQNDWNKYGKENFEFIVLHDLQDGENITEIEEQYIKQYKDKNGAKYDIDTVKYIRYLYEQENMSNQEIADKLSIPRGTIYQITSYRRWKYA